MRILVLGAGLQGSSCAYDLLRQDDVEWVTLADLAPEGAAFLPDTPKLHRLQVDFSDETALREIMQGHDVVLSAAPYYFNTNLARLAIEAGLDYSDLGGNTDIVFAQLDMAGEAGANGCTAVPDVGLAPGMINVLAAEAIRRMDEPESVIMYVGGLPQHPHPPLNYQVVYSLEGALDYYTTPSWIIRGGRAQRIEALSEIETLNFGELGELEAFHTGGGASTMPFRFEGRVDRLEYKTLRYPGHAHIMHAIRELGLLADEPVPVDSVEVVPRDVFLTCAKPHLTFPGEPDLVALRVVGRGTRGGRPATLVWELLDHEDTATGITAMERTTGFTLAIVGLLMGRDVIEETGVFAPDEAIPTDIYLQELEERGIRIELRETDG